MMKVCEERSQKENVLIRNGDCCVTFAPQLGGKIASIRVKDTEVLQPPLAPLGERTRTMPFDESDASGWDECVPSVAACVLEAGGARIEVPDHGDVWRVAWETIAESANSLTLRTRCFSLPLEMVRKGELAKTSRGWRLHLDYTMTNRGDATIPWSWCAHPLFDVAPGDQIELPPSVSHLRLEGSGGGRLGKGGATVQWPMAQLADGSTSDLRMVQPVDSGIGDKLFAGPLSPSEGWCTLHRPAAGLSLRMSFDVTKTPYLGLWLCYGGWPDRSGPKQNCVALEPATAPVDSLAQTGPWSRTLAPGSFCSWTMAVEFELVES